MTTPPSNFARFLHTPDYWEPTDGQLAAYEYLWHCATTGVKMVETAFWEAWERPEAPDVPTKPVPPPDEFPKTLELAVPYNNQRNNINTYYDGADSQCYATSIGIVLEYHGIMSCDDYLRRYPPFGGSTNPNTHARAMADLPVRAVYRQDGTMEQIKEILRVHHDPVPVGWYQKGYVSGPIGGHWSVVIGYDETTRQWIQHDPYGEADMVNGGWTARNPTTGENGPGKRIRYSFENFHRRASVAASGLVVDGNYWMWEITPLG